jgi:tetratricopeptide (TPR) repeat protein
MVSSTAHDLPEHRKEVEDACLRQGMFPVMMERLPASDAEAISASLSMVDEADIYVGVFAHRYGYVPKEGNPRRISVTEMEYDRAVERNVPRQIFIIDKKHPLGDFTIDDIDKGESAERLAQFKSRVEAENIVNYFKSPADLRAHVINSLSQLRKPDLTKFHYVTDIPAAPEPFIAHPYTLLQTHRLVGRQPELNLLTDWVAKPNSEVYKAHILNVVAVGGMGKSALTWKWFNDIAPQEMTPLAGRLWWSFYESDATFENFVTRALAYTTRRPLAEVLQIPAPDRESQLLAALNREPYLLVLDGLERILIAYARMDAARLEDSQVGNQRSLRKTADPRVGRFLKKLAQGKNSRILISTRLYPADLETEGGDPLPGSSRRDITGLTDEDAVKLWRALNVTGSRDILLPVFATIDKHPLLIQALAGEVKRYRRAPGNFEEWRKANPQFDPTKFSLLRDAMNHVLKFALRGLNGKASMTLQIIAAFRMPTTYDTLTALLVGKGKTRFDLGTGKITQEEGRLFDEERRLDETLSELEECGLVGWDKRANRYDLHPIVRGVVWYSLSAASRHGLYKSLHAHFDALPTTAHWENINSLEDLTSAIELYNTLIGLGRYDDAGKLFHERLQRAMFYRLSNNRQMVELLEMLFPDGLEHPPRLSRPVMQAVVLSALAQGYKFSLQPRRAAPLYHRANSIVSGMNLWDELSAGLCNLSDTLRLSGMLREAEVVVRQALINARKHGNRFYELISLYRVGVMLTARGIVSESDTALGRSLRICVTASDRQAEGLIKAYLAQRASLMGDFVASLSFAGRAWELAHIRSGERDFIRAARLQGEAAIGLGDFATADERLHYALTRARMVSFVEEELPTLVALAELRRRQGELGAAWELLEEVWEAAERGPYPLIHADACCVLAEVERDEGNVEKAVEAAGRAYRLAWCDGPPFAYHWGLERARKLLKELGAGELVLLAFDESKFEPMPEVEIDPADEFGAGSEEEKEG